MTAQNSFVTEGILMQIKKLAMPLPSDIQEAYQHQAINKARFDSIDQMIKDAYPVIADKINRRSMMLNALAGFSVENTERYLLTANQAFADYFIRQWDKFDAMEKPIAPSLKLPPALKALYKKNGYLPVWDSVYQKRIPLLKKYCDGVLKLVQN
jgi:hypothetical protein